MGLFDRFFKTREESKAANPDAEYERLAEQSMEELRLKTAVHDGGWDHPFIPEPTQQHATVVREYGEQHGYKWLTTQLIQCPEDKAWQLVAFACRLNDAQGAHRGPTGDTTVFITFDDVSLAKAD